MLVRCEQCRAVYQIDLGPAGANAAVQCIRCQHLFEASAPVSIGVQGTLGGAAALAVADSPTLRVLKAPKSWSGIVSRSVVGVSLAALIAGGIVWRMHIRAAQQAEAAPDADQRSAAGEVLLWRDDNTSLEAAISAFSDAHALQPQNARYAAQEVLARLLLGMALGDEQQDLKTELRQAESVSESKAPSEADRLAAGVRADDLRQRLPGVTAQADREIKTGLAEVAHVRLMPGAMLLPAMNRAVRLADAVAGREPTARAAVAAPRDSNAPPARAWAAFVSGVSELSKVPVDWSAARRDFQAAVDASPRFIRAKWELARTCLAASPPDKACAQAALASIEQLNPRHEGAARMRQMLAVKPAASP